MQKALFLLLPVLSGLTAFSQLHTGFSYSLAIPQGQMAENINLTHGGVLDVFYKFKKTPNLRTGIQLGGGTYAHTKQDQHYTFRDGSSTDVKVTFSSNVFNGHVVAGYDLSSPGADIIPYVTAKAGFSKFYSSLYIPDPDHNDGCRPLENKNVFKDATWSAGGGAGLRMNFRKVFTKGQTDIFWFDLSVNYLTGGELDYLNVKNLQHHEDNTAPDPKGFNVRFVNITTNEMHEHNVSKVLISRINQLDVRLGVVMKLNCIR